MGVQIVGPVRVEGTKMQRDVGHIDRDRQRADKASRADVQPEPFVVQTKLRVGAADDPMEVEADRIARQVVAALSRPSVAADVGDAGDDASSGGRIRRRVTSTATPPAGVMPAARIQRIAARPNAAPALSSTRIQRRAAYGPAGGELDEQTSTAISNDLGGGRPLDGVARSSMESAFGTDFSNVRVHSGSSSDQLNDRLGASAFTVGSDIFFRGSTPDVSTPGGQELLAHELTHVVQQSGSARRTVQRRAKPGARYLRPGGNPRVDRNDPAVIAGELAEAEQEEREEQEEIAKLARQLRRSAPRAKARRKGPAANTNYRGGIPGRVAFGVKAVVKNLPDCAVKRVVPAGPNGTAHIDPTDYGICDTETLSPGDFKVTAVRDGNEWHLEATKIVARYSKIIQLPNDVTEITGPNGGGAGQTTTANSAEQITCLLATFGPPWYLLASVDGHESVHETRLLPALRNISAEIQDELAQITVPYTKDPVANPGGFADKATALTALVAKPEYAAALSSAMGLWDAEYDDLIDDDHQGKAQKGEEKASRPLIDKINKFRVENKMKKIPVKYTWTPY